MKLYNIFLYAFLSIGIFTSCESDLDIELEDDDDLLASDVFNTRDDYRRALGGVYANFSLVGLDVDAAGDPNQSNLAGIDAGTSQYVRGLFSMQDVSTDQVIWTYENDPGIREIQRNTWDANNVIVLGFWARATFEISLANEFLRQTNDAALDGRGVSGDLRNEIQIFRAEARVLRALSYYHLLDLYGRAPFATENDAVGFTRLEEIKGTELFNYIETELLAVDSSLLDVNPSQNYARADKGVAKMILAKLYLNAEVYTGTARYADCLNVCQEIINSGYSLTPNYKYNFIADNDTNGAQTEIIFPIVGDGANVRNFGGASIIIQGQQNADGFEPTPASMGVQGFTTLYRARRQFSELFVTDPIFQNDTRNTLVTQDVSTDPDNTDPPVDRPIEIGTDFTDFANGYLVNKYSNISSTGVPGQSVRFVDTDYPMFRLADVYLMYAEAQLNNGGGDRATALGFINALRERAFGDTSGNITDAEMTLDFILDERARELYWEGHRRQDLIRYNRYTGGAYNWRYKGGVPNGSSISENFKLFPVPASSRAANPNLGQNLGF